MLQISLSKAQFMVILFLEDLFPVIPKDLDQERVYRSQLRGSNGFSPFSLLVKASCQPGIDQIEKYVSLKLLYRAIYMPYTVLFLIDPFDYKIQTIREFMVANTGD